MKPQSTHAGPTLSYLSNKCVIRNRACPGLHRRGHFLTIWRISFPLSHTVADLKYIPRKARWENRRKHFLKNTVKVGNSGKFLRRCVNYTLYQHSIGDPEARASWHHIWVGGQTFALTRRNTTGSCCERDTCLLGAKDVSAPDCSQRYC